MDSQLILWTCNLVALASMAFLAPFYAVLLPASLAQMETITSCISRAVSIVGSRHTPHCHHTRALSRKSSLEDIFAFLFAYSLGSVASGSERV
jgi:hypothetical protein